MAAVYMFFTIATHRKGSEEVVNPVQPCISTIVDVGVSIHVGI